VPEAELVELRRRIDATRFPDRETVTDASQGVQLATTQKLARYWATQYDWRKCEARLQALPHFITEIDGLDIHFIHVRSKHKGALPVIVTHGWPGSIVEQFKIIEPLTNPTAHGGSASDAYGFQMGLRPQTLCAIADSPVGLAAYFLDHDARSYDLIARVFDGQSEGLTRDDILDNMGAAAAPHAGDSRGLPVASLVRDGEGGGRRVPAVFPPASPPADLLR